MITSDALLEGLLSHLAERLAPLLAAKLGQGTAPPRYADATSNPFGTERGFLDAARRGDFPTFRKTRRITALWADVEAAIEQRSRRTGRAPAPPSQDEADRAALEAMGVKCKPENDRVKRAAGSR